MFVIKYKNIFLTIGGVLMATAIACIAYFGLSLGIDFTGGSILEVRFNDRPSIAAVEKDLSQLGIQDASVRPSGASNYIIRTPFLEANQRSQLMAKLRETATTASSSEQVDALPATTTTDANQPTTTATTTNTQAVSAESATSSLAVSQVRFASIGPTVGSELAANARWGMLGVITAIILFIAFAFRKVSEPVSSWVYGGTAIIALLHDILIPTGVFAVLGHVMGAQVDLLFVMALLAILGYSVNDTIVVFDRIRENLRENFDDVSGNFADTVGQSLSQTYARSINTSLTTLIVLAALYFLGGEPTRLFALTLLVGVLAGTYSSIFFASPLLVQFREWQKNSS